MKYSYVAVSALATLASAKPSFLNSNFDVTEGDKFTLKFSGCDSGCTIVIQTGPSDHLTDVKTLKTGVTGDSFDFTPSDIPSGTYNFKIFADSDPADANYSKQFQYEGTGPALTTGSTSASASATSAASSSEESSTGSASASATTSGSSSAETTMSTATSSAESSAASTSEASATTSEASASTSAASSASTTVPGNAGARATPFAMVVGAVAALAAL